MKHKYRGDYDLHLLTQHDSHVVFEAYAEQSLLGVRNCDWYLATPVNTGRKIYSGRIKKIEISTVMADVLNCLLAHQASLHDAHQWQASSASSPLDWHLLRHLRVDLDERERRQKRTGLSHMHCMGCGAGFGLD